MPKVIVKRASYDYAVLRPAFFSIMDSLGGNAIKRGSRVVIKPNLLAPAPPGKAVVTHPLVVKAAAEYVLGKGAAPQISDSPPMGSFERVLKESGIRSALEGLDVEFREFGESAAVDIGEPFGKIEIARDAVEADVLINLPKLKTHTQMLLTLGVKNLFGCIVGLRKPEWHFRTGVDREMFAKLLFRIYNAVKPSFTVLDGILAMEGQGPGKGGIPRGIGVLAGGSDAVALDYAVCGMLGIAPERLLTNKAAKECGMPVEGVEIDGEFPEVPDFRLPGTTSLIFGPRILHGVMRKHFVQRPVSDRSLCTFCGECGKYCPAKAIKYEREKIIFDYDKCIRCYCCVEVCPRGALKARETLPGRIVRRAAGRGGV
ncbi:MAG TPA: DUF362 domain-containing protein [Dissulfurispiraceae bacterium]